MEFLRPAFLIGEVLTRVCRKHTIIDRHQAGMKGVEFNIQSVFNSRRLEHRQS
jgi:hypothetical protein